jgi:F-type H+-transporting ATPase subunit b
MNLIQTAYSATHETAEVVEQGLLGSMGIDLKMFILQLVNLAIVFGILWFLILKPLTQKLSERQKTIDETLENSKKIDEMLKKSESDYKDQMTMAKSEANNIIEKAKKDAELTADTIKNNTKNGLNEMAILAKKNIDDEKRKMIGEFKKEASDVVVLALKKIMEKNYDATKDEKTINEALKMIK